MHIDDQRLDSKKERVPVVPGGVYVQGESAMLLVKTTRSPFEPIIDANEIYYFVSLRDGEHATIAFARQELAATLNLPTSNIAYCPDATLVLKGAK